MKKALIFLLACLWIFAACAPSQPATSAAPNVETMVASTFEALTAAAPPTPQPAGLLVTFQNVSFVIPNGLATNALAGVVPAVSPTNESPGWDVAPDHVKFELDNYSLYGRFHDPVIRIYPAQEYAAMSESAKQSMERLQTILADPSAPMDEKALPSIPFFNAGQMIAAQVTRLGFNTGNGVRMIAQYGQAVMPITNDQVFYHFQSLTSDGKYYVIAVLPISHPLLASVTDPSSPLPEGGIPFPDMMSSDAAAFETYFQAVVNLLNTADPNFFQPALPLLDALIQSITIAP